MKCCFPQNLEFSFHMDGSLGRKMYHPVFAFWQPNIWRVCGVGTSSLPLNGLRMLSPAISHLWYSRCILRLPSSAAPFYITRPHYPQAGDILIIWGMNAYLETLRVSIYLRVRVGVFDSLLRHLWCSRGLPHLHAILRHDAE